MALTLYDWGSFRVLTTEKDFAFPRDKVIAYRNFSNKIWNMARFIKIMLEKLKEEDPQDEVRSVETLMNHISDVDRDILSGLNDLNHKHSTPV